AAPPARVGDLERARGELVDQGHARLLALRLAQPGEQRGAEGRRRARGVDAGPAHELREEGAGHVRGSGHPVGGDPAARGLGAHRAPPMGTTPDGSGPTGVVGSGSGGSLIRCRLRVAAWSRACYRGLGGGSPELVVQTLCATSWGVSTPGACWRIDPPV